MAATHRPIAFAAAVATAVTLGTAAALATPAVAAETPLEGYELTWGIKESYRNYVTGMAAGSFTTTDGASQAAGNGAFTFTGGTGTYDSTTHAVALGFKGSLTAESALHGFEVTLSDVKFNSATAQVTADVTKDGETDDDVPLAEVTVNRAMTDMTTTLTKEAADALGSASYEGAAGDPLTVVEKETETQSPSPSASQSTSESAAPSPSVSATASASASASATASSSASATEAADQGDIVDGELGWGVKESFRTYVVDGVAKGEITTADGASQASGNGAFTFTDGTGEYDTDADTLSASFAGSVTFKGHEEDGEYGLDMTLSGLQVELDGGSGTLTADIASLGETSENVVLADLKAGSSDLTATDDVISLDDITATLTDEGADAFGGFYTSGTELDPVDVDVALSDSAELPGDADDSGTDGTSGTSGTSGTTGGTGTTGSTTGGTGSLASTGADVPAGPLAAASALIVAAGAAVVVAARKRRTTIKAGQA